MGPIKQKDGNQHIHVAVRCRPMNATELADRNWSIVEVCAEKKTIAVKEKMGVGAPSRMFTFDKVFGTHSKQIEIYKAVVEPTVEEVIMGYNCTIFAYGQTGTGKTFTMEGERSAEHLRWEDDPMAGIIPRSLAHLFEKLESTDCEFSMRVSYLELYNEELFDLLGSHDYEQKLRIYDDAAKKGSVVIQGLEEVVVRNKHEVYSILQKGSVRRQTAATILNATSSRSHTVFTVTVHTKENSVDGEELVRTGKLNLVDLAGSENIGRSGAVDKRAREAGNINQSLLTLGRVITALVEHTPHVPYRESKLTRILQDSLGGRTKTSIIATISPANSNFEETLSTLDYAHRAKNITNKPEINQKLTKKNLIKEYNDEIERLRKDLQASRDKNGIFIDEGNYKEMQAQLCSQATIMKEQVDSIAAITEDNSKLQDELLATSNRLTETEVLLQEKCEKLEKTVENLERTRNKLAKTIQLKDEQTHLVSQHVVNEGTLTRESQTLLSTLTTTTKDVSTLQETVARKSRVESENLLAIAQFQQTYTSNTSSILSAVKEFASLQEQESSAIKSMLDVLKGTQFKHTEAETTALDGMAAALHSQADGLLSKLTPIIYTTEQAANSVSQHCIANKEVCDSAISTFKEGILASTQATMKIGFSEMRLTLAKLAKDCKQMCATVAERQKTFLALITDVVHSGQVQMERFFSDIVKTVTQLEALKEKDLLQEKADYAETDKKLQEMAAQIEFLRAKQNAHMETKQQFFNSLSTHYESVQHLTKQQSETHTQTFATVSKCADALVKDVQTLQADGMSIVSSDQEKVELIGNSLEENHLTLCSGFDENCSSVKASIEKFNMESASCLSKFVEVAKKNIYKCEADLKEMDVHFAKASNVLTDSLNNACADVNSQVKRIVLSIQNSQQHNERFVTDNMAALNNQAGDVTKLVEQDIRKDVSTGVTPENKIYQYPRYLAKPLVHKSLLSQFRQEQLQKQEAIGQETSLPSDDDDEGEEVADCLLSSDDTEQDKPEQAEANEDDELDDSTVSIASNLSKTSANTLANAESKENLAIIEDRVDCSMITRRRERNLRTVGTLADSKKEFKKPLTPKSITKAAASSARQAATKSNSAAPKRKLPAASPGLARKQLKPTNQ